MPTKSWFSITHPAFLPKVACGRCDRARREQAGEPSAGEDTQPRAGFSSRVGRLRRERRFPN